MVVNIFIVFSLSMIDFSSEKNYPVINTIEKAILTSLFDNFNFLTKSDCVCMCSICRFKRIS